VSPLVVRSAEEFAAVRLATAKIRLPKRLRTVTCSRRRRRGFRHGRPDFCGLARTIMVVPGFRGESAPASIRPCHSRRTIQATETSCRRARAPSSQSLARRDDDIGLSVVPSGSRHGDAYFTTYTTSKTGRLSGVLLHQFLPHSPRSRGAKDSPYFQGSLPNYYRPTKKHPLTRGQRHAFAQR